MMIDGTHSSYANFDRSLRMHDVKRPLDLAHLFFHSTHTLTYDYLHETHIQYLCRGQIYAKEPN